MGDAVSSKQSIWLPRPVHIVTHLVGWLLSRIVQFLLNVEAKFEAVIIKTGSKTR